MNCQNQQIPLNYSPAKKRFLILTQFALIIFIYHTLKDLKDSLVITASDAGVEVIPFIKIWAILPLSILASYLFSKLYQKFGREKTLYIFVSSLLGCYVLFAFCLYPLRDVLYLENVEAHLKMALPIGCKGLISMISYWIFSFFYFTAELWSLLILTVLFWGYVNDTTTMEQAKSFYPICTLVGNCAGILAGQVSHYFCHSLTKHLSWQQTLQWVILLVALCGVGIMLITRRLSHYDVQEEISRPKSKPEKMSFKECILSIFQSRPLFCIAVLVVGFALTSNLIEVVWKGHIKSVYPLPQDYNAYMNQLTSLIGIFAVTMSLVSRFLFKRLSWSTIALMTPVILFTTSLLFFSSIYLPINHVSKIAFLLNMNPLYFIMTLGAIHYVVALTAKYTIFDMSKEIAFLSIDSGERIRAKSVIDTIGSRLGKSGSSCLYQFLLIAFGSLSGHISVIGALSLLIIGNMILATKKLGDHVSAHPSAKDPEIA